MRETIQGQDVRKDDLVYFPNSRRPQPVGSVTPTDEGTTILLSADGASRWLVPNDFAVQREVSENGD